MEADQTHHPDWVPSEIIVRNGVNEEVIRYEGGMAPSMQPSISNPNCIDIWHNHTVDGASI